MCVCVSVCVCVCVHERERVYISPILIKTADFKNLAWATSFPLGQVENSSTCPTGQVGEKSIVTYI